MIGLGVKSGFANRIDASTPAMMRCAIVLGLAASDDATAPVTRRVSYQGETQGRHVHFSATMARFIACTSRF